MVDYLNLARRVARRQEEYKRAVEQVIEQGWFILGRQLLAFEEEYAQYIGTKHCVGVGNGLDALTLIYRACMELGRMEEGDEVIVPANTYIASILAIAENGLVPVLADANPVTMQVDDRQLESLITKRTRSVMIVHLYGRCAYTKHIEDICKKHQLLLVEDNAQAQGCRYGNIRTGALGYAAGHSFYPTKNLGAMGDAGAITTNDDQLADMVRTLRNYGSKKKYVFEHLGRNSRMDEIQAAVLRVGLQHLDEDNRRRQEVAQSYNDGICQRAVQKPAIAPQEENVWHIYPILCDLRDKLRGFLAQQGVEAQVHYPIPPHQQGCCTNWRYESLDVTERIHHTELSLPMGPELTDEDVMRVVEAVNKFPQ
ncbi:MAG: DegT/DnrJ/EryC1/StrS family aminotransferase [Prevotella sp.]|nr:DegT/DnrJ/EryC1/StrS family aminotransferase [Prevotella sp.]